MPIEIKQLNRAQQREYLHYLRDMKAEGLPVDIPDEWQEPCPLVITPLPMASTVCNLGESNTGYAIHLRIASEARVIVKDYQISSEWDEASIELPYLCEAGGRYKCGQMDYAVNDVLNDKLERALRFNGRGDMVEGVIMAYGCVPIPNKYQIGAIVFVRLAFTDSLDRTVQRDIGLQVAQRAAKRDRNLVRTGTGLYGPVEQKETNLPSVGSENPELTFQIRPCDGPGLHALPHPIPPKL